MGGRIVALRKPADVYVAGRFALTSDLDTPSGGRLGLGLRVE